MQHDFFATRITDHPGTLISQRATIGIPRPRGPHTGKKTVKSLMSTFGDLHEVLSSKPLSTSSGPQTASRYPMII